ncbi:extracellular solute-binding protein [Microbacterium sp. ASV81]|uniref:Extracellular solute-binding protein n=1 Tax=Microbacterium capsulatum TaxID=3041921 RepID=A0ABU0XHL3_9MICO|nr:extracellular solute-binding protein [Microbacterium sp. ASV81]MDQ4214618.1 extracellular solute-binding protein [Microbacterium sp. ASV81]
MNLRTRGAGIAGLAALTVIALAGCASANASTTPVAGSMATLSPSDKVAITFESYNLSNAGIWSNTITTLLDEFQKEHPNITVKAQPSDSSSTAGSVQKEILAGGAPDVAQITFGELDFAATTLGAQNLTSVVGKTALDDEFGGKYPYNPRAKVLADWKGATYGLPYVFSTPVLWINKAMFTQAGLDPATVDLSTWDAVEAAGKKISAATGKPSVSVTCTVTGGNWCMQSLFRSNGAQVLSDDRKKIGFGSAEAVSTVKTFRDMFEAGVLANQDGTTQYESFAKGQTAIHVNTSALQGAFMAGAKAGNWTLDARPLPSFGSKAVVPTNSGSFLAMFSKDPKKQAAAWELMQWMTSSHAYESISTKIGYLPLRSSMTQKGGPLYDWVEQNPLVKPNLKQLDALQPWVSYPGNSYVQIDQVLATAIENSVYYGKDPSATMKDAAQRAQGMIK